MAKFRYVVTEEDKGIPVKGLIRQRFTFSSRMRTKLKYQNLVRLNGEEVAGWITPVPGGVGPMTVAMLMNNVARALAFQEE